jgi:hypothetical protein
MDISSSAKAGTLSGPYNFFIDFLTAIDGGNLDAVKKFIENGINIHGLEDAALRIATDKGYADIVKMLSKMDA